MIDFSITITQYLKKHSFMKRGIYKESIIKRNLIMAIMLLAIIQLANGMIPGPALLVSCPNCGAEKSLMTIISGNTFGACQWSDMYQYAPMLPSLSPVQKCNECGGYFILSKAKHRYAEEDEDVEHYGDTGRLTYNEIKEALVLLNDDSLTEDEKLGIRIEFLHRYNDAFREFEGNYIEMNEDKKPMKRDKKDQKLHKSNLTALIALLDKTDNNDILLIAELYREGGNFDKCIEILSSYRPNDDYVRSFISKLMKKAEEKNDKVFLIDEDEPDF